MRTVVPNVRAWRHDLGGCLHACLASLLEHRGVAALPVLGAGWTFRHFPKGVRREEYYYPCTDGESLLSAVAPHHPVRSRWHHPADADAGWAQVRDAVAAGAPVAVAVDNFHLPFRPAHRDVHSNHLIVVHGFDDNQGTVRVLDAVPPAFHGDIGLAELTAARDSGNPAVHARDMFFTGVDIGNRWLSVEIDGEPDQIGSLDRARVAHVVAANLDHFRAPSSIEGYVGLAGQRAFLDSAVDALRTGEDIGDELFVAAGAVLACTALHADWLALAGHVVDSPDLRECGREVERLAHHWSAVRIMAALARTGDLAPARLAGRAHTLMADHETALENLDRARRQL
ncbi:MULTISPECIES: BtrH N-terminal domain-containing protein [unclassified Micromonospora]|uniref:BtrH N-terminal domain-containing protein n=1 Tax=unclassified Micromonospora TaxID=2617518 RepID=UPI001C249858|nr:MULTISPECIES: BtrH N-terminal domain-containing protein [unclassified Micromonospora]MBU8858605.1 BtrH N-terminal domain-containing protein [Micromonospora sp. WMMB482]MDM4784249.1 BtrH N-terminal domain-containing protein [Micromonospora sp. b486]